MNAKFSLSRDEWKGFARIVQSSCRAVSMDDFFSLQCKEALQGLLLKLAGRLPLLKEKKNKVTLSDMETAVVWMALNDNCDAMPPYERGMAVQLIRAMDALYLEEKRRLSINVVTAVGGNLLSE